MTSIDPRAMWSPWYCPWCRTTRPAGDHMWPLAIGTTESSGCIDCALDAENGNRPRRGDDT